MGTIRKELTLTRIGILKLKYKISPELKRRTGNKLQHPPTHLTRLTNLQINKFTLFAQILIQIYTRYQRVGIKSQKRFCCLKVSLKLYKHVANSKILEK